ncbi:MAG: permease [Campylobacterota bacterium]|nr:permease [Campylobacterota bacterium]
MKKPSVYQSILKSAKIFLSIMPMLLGVILLTGLFDTLVSEEMLHSVFNGNPIHDTLLGLLVGGVSVGQPVISYIIGGELLQSGVSLYAVTAFIISWVTLGVVQLPLELQFFGGRFTLQRNLLSFIFAVFVSVMSVQALRLFT